MSRHLIMIALFSFLVAMFTTQAAFLLSVVQGMYDYIDKVLSIEIGGYSFSQNIREFIALILAALLSAVIARLVYWLMKKSPSAVVPGVMWAVWLILATVLMNNA